MPKLVHLYIRQVAIGYLLSACFVALLLWLNVANLWHLVTHTDGGWVAVGMLWIFNGVVFAGVQFGISVMRMGRDDDDTGRGKRITFATPTVPEDGRLAVSTDEPR
ncbi:hypothetical protein CLV78_102166 [Aliiruegeria haliotis]|uniref:Uncharacterized protein n=1 Tax=Aliiruegeria haliotis TaxID=1280846 RepID=A0A2T0RV36_9RHOB|nr:hypothetical protein [Aliiruegeria haliotis]PRY24992.1 hypothetical protein CLV78_102166 [Aliiruegeria haliotis]